MEIEVEGFKPYPRQKEFIDQIEDPSVKYCVLTIGRQWGKTLLAQNLILKWALENNNSDLLWLSPVYSQVRKVFDDIVNAIEGTPILVSSNKSNYEMELINGSKLIFRSGEKPDAIRGYTFTHMIVDESAFIKDEIWNTVLKPTILVKGKKCLFISTPKGKNWLYELHQRGIDPDQTKYISLQGTSYDNPYIDHDELDEARKTIPEDIFEQEIMGKYVDSGGEVFTDIDRYCVIPMWGNKVQGKKYYAGLDVGRQHDYSVLTIMDDDQNVVFIYRDNNKPWDVILDNVVKHLKRFNATCMIETNGIGDPLMDQLSKKYKDVHPFVTTNTSKQQIIEDLIYQTNTDNIKLPTQDLFPPLYNELKTFSYSYSPSSRKVVYKGIGNTHDDCIMSLAISLNSLREKKTKGSYYIY